MGGAFKAPHSEHSGMRRPRKWAMTRYVHTMAADEDGARFQNWDGAIPGVALDDAHKSV